MKKYKLKNIIRGIIREQTSMVGHENINFTICDCVPLTPTGGACNGTFAKGNTIPYSASWTGLEGFRCDGDECKPNDINKEFQADIFNYRLTFTLNSYDTPVNCSHIYHPNVNPMGVANYSGCYNMKPTPCSGVTPVLPPKPTGTLSNDPNVPRGIDCQKFWSKPGNFATTCCNRCKDMNLHPLTHPNHSCSKWCECCTSPR